jgi:hypothetical protein
LGNILNKFIVPNKLIAFEREELIYLLAETENIVA